MTAALVQFVSLSVFAFGALSFSLLAVTYWREGKRRGGRLFPLFTLVCAASFLASTALLFPAVAARPAILTIRDMLTALVPPMMVHLALQRTGWASLWFPRAWQCAAVLLYAWSMVPSSDEAPAIRMATCAGLALAGLVRSRNGESVVERRHRRWNAVLFALLLVTAVGSWLGESPLYEMAPDYLLLGFFAVWLYYSERLTFFDVVLRGGAYFLCGAMLTGALIALFPEWAGAAAGLMAVWLLGPLAHRHLNTWVDRRALKRVYSEVEAEREFTLAIQRFTAEEQLRGGAQAALSALFQSEAEVRFEGRMPESTEGDLQVRLEPHGYVRLRARPSTIPYLSDDQRLLATLAATLGVVFQNVRFRAREQMLADHAAQAELRALRAQINPHFLFNALNAIAGWIRVRPELADDTVAQLAEVFRYALNRSQQEWVRLGEEMDFVRSWLAVEKARFGERLEVEIASEAGVEMMNVPAMLIQPVVENAIRHGTGQVQGIGRVRVTVKRDGDGHVIVQVEDNGPGFPEGFALAKNGGESHSMWNVAERLNGYYGDSGGLRWENTAMGCRVRIQFPAELRN